MSERILDYFATVTLEELEEQFEESKYFTEEIIKNNEQ